MTSNLPFAARSSRFPLAAFVAVVAMSALADGNESVQLVDFRRDVFPIISQTCVKCHSADKHKGGLRMTGRMELLKGGETGPALVPGDAKKSLLMERVTSHHPDKRMPAEGKPLSSEQVSTLRAWIDQGAKWEEPAAYRLALMDVHVPAGEGNPIDGLLAAYFKQHGITAARPIDDARFARRAALDLLGIGATEVQRAGLQSDTRPDRRERFVRGLLEDRDGYTAHWMTFWSDHLRIGSAVDSGIFDDDGTKKPRDWLKSELDRGTPYDQFARDLLASDFYEQYARSAAPPGEVASPVDRPEMQVATTVSQVFLGVQLKCASCHDSFVDRWTLDDSWGLAGALGDPAVEIQRCQAPTGRRATPSFPLRGLGQIDPALDAPHRRQRVAAMMTSAENGLFARTIVNRLWARLFGRGLIEPLDEMMEHEAWSPELLDYLAGELVRQHYDVRQVLLLIMSSNAYQSPAVSRSGRFADGAYVFRGPEVRRLAAEQFVDTLGTLRTAATTRPAARAWEQQNDKLMTVLGRPGREVVVTWRDTEVTPLVALELINGGQLEHLVEDAANAQLAAGGDAAQLVNRICRPLLGRDATADEQRVLTGVIGVRPTPTSVADAIWAVVMLPEFQLLP